MTGTAERGPLLSLLETLEARPGSEQSKTLLWKIAHQKTGIFAPKSTRGQFKQLMDLRKRLSPDDGASPSL